MKVRNGFVSNSSTSSFCIYGAFVNLHKTREEVLQKCKEFVGPDCSDDFYEALEDVANKLDLSVSSVSEGNSYYIGKSWPSIKDNQTAKEFKDEIQAAISKVFDDIKCDTYEEAYYC